MNLGPEPDQVTVYSNGQEVAVLERHFNTLDLSSDAPPFMAKVYDFHALYWTHTGMILRLQGATLLDVLSPTLYVLRGKHRPDYHPRPGMDDVRVVVPTFNPRGLPPVEVFQLAVRLGF